jgi:dolichyl-phosphate-mannose-protein mannosyltransferase
MRAPNTRTGPNGSRPSRRARAVAPTEATGNGRSGPLANEPRPAGGLGRKDPHVRFLLLLIVIGILAFWVPRMSGSLWVDETTTAWTVDAGFGDMLDRSVEFQSMPPTYFIVAWTARQVGGSSEVALRLPSLLAMCLAIYLTYRLGRRLFDAETGLIAAVVLTTWNSGAHLATDARPYAFGVLAFVAATLALVRWVDRGRTRDGVAYLLLAALVLYVHYILAPVLLAHVVYLWLRRQDLPSRRALVAGALAFGVVLVPIVPIVTATLGVREALSLGTPSPGEVLLVILPPEVLAALAAGVALAAGRIRVDTDLAARDPAGLPMIAVWAAAPAVALFAISLAIGAGVLGAQHITIAAPAIALIAAWAIRHLTPAQVRRIVLVSMVIVSLLLGAFRRQYTDDWRGAVAYANGLVADRSAPVLVRSGLVQGGRIEWLTDPHRTPIVLAPVQAYPVDGNAMPLPYGLSEEERRYLEAEIVPLAASGSDLVVITWTNGDGVLPWLEGRLRSSGFELRRARMFGSVLVGVLERP